MARAFQPVGAMSVATSATGSFPATALVGSSVGAAFGDAFQRTSALTTVGFDQYRRMFRINLAGGFPTARPSLVAGGVAPVMRETRMVLGGKGVQFSLTAAASTSEPGPDLRNGLVHEDPNQRTDLDLELTAGRFSFSAWRGRGGMAPSADLAASSNTFAVLSRPDHAFRAAYGLHGLTVAAEMGAGSRQPFFGVTELQPSSYALASLGMTRGRWSATAAFGRLSEPRGPSGSLLPGRTSFSMPAVTDFASVHADWAAAARLLLSAEASLGRTRTGDAFLTMTRPLMSSSWRITARTQCSGPRDDCTHLELDLAQPVRIEGGTFGTLLADVPAAYGDPLYFSHRSFSAAPSGREIDLRLGVDRSWRGFGLLQLQLLAVHDDGNQSGGPVGMGVLANWRTRF